MLRATEAHGAHGKAAASHNAQASEMKRERLKWWRYALLRFGREPSDRASPVAEADAAELVEDIAAVKAEGAADATDAEREAAAKKQGYTGLDYSVWEAWEPDDPASKEEAAEAEAAKQRAEDSAFEAANPQFCGQFLADMRKRREKEAQKVEDSKRLRLKGNAAFKAGRSERALTLYHECLSLTPFDVAVLNNLAAAAGATGQLESAVDFADRSLYLDAHQPKALFRRAGLLRRLGMSAAAVLDLTRAAAEKPGNAQIRHALLDAQAALEEEREVKAADALLSAGDSKEHEGSDGTFSVRICAPSPAESVTDLCAFIVAAGDETFGSRAQAVGRACTLLHTALQRGSLAGAEETPLPSPLQWSTVAAPAAPAPVPTTAAVLHALIRQSGALDALLHKLTHLSRSSFPRNGNTVLPPMLALIAVVLERPLSASVVREANCIPLLAGWLAGIAANAATPALAFVTPQGWPAPPKAASSSHPRGRHTLEQLSLAGVSSVASDKVPSARTVGKAVSLLLTAVRQARPHDTDGEKDERFLRQLVQTDRALIHTALPQLLLWIVACLTVLPAPGAGDTSSASVSSDEAQQAQESCMGLLDDVASLVQFVALRSNTDAVPGAVTDGAVEAWAEATALCPVPLLLRSIGAVLPRAMLDEGVLLHPCLQAATAALAYCAHHPALREFFATRMDTGSAAARGATALHPLVSLLHLPSSDSGAWERVSAQSMAALTNACTQCPAVAAAAVEAGAPAALHAAISATLGLETEAPVPAVTPLVLLRTSGLLSRLAIMDSSGAALLHLRKASTCKQLAGCLGALIDRQVFGKGPALPISGSEGEHVAGCTDSLVLLVTAMTTTKQAASSTGKAGAAAAGAALAILIRCGAMGSLVAWLGHCVRQAQAAARARIAPTVAALPAGGAAGADPRLVERLPVPPSALRSSLAPRLRACGNVAKFITNSAAAATAGAAVDPSNVFEAALLGNAVEALTEVVKAAEEGSPVRQNAAIALARLAKDPACRARLRECGGMGVLMQLHKEIAPAK